VPFELPDEPADALAAAPAAAWAEARVRGGADRDTRQARVDALPAAEKAGSSG